MARNNIKEIHLKYAVEDFDKLKDHEKPLVAIVGGAKLETKLPAINNLAKVSDRVLVGGRLMFEVERQTLSDTVVIAPDDLDQKDIGRKSVDSFRKILQ